MITERLEALLARMHELQDEIEDVYRETRDEWAREKARLAGEFLHHQLRFRTGVLLFLRTARPMVVLTSPVIYAGWIPFLLIDLFVSLYQAICFPVYGIPKVRRRDYLVFDRGDLPYLNVIEKFNCFYCSYANGVAAYTREVASRTEQYWCPIKHARRVHDAHERYPRFFEHGDAETYRRGLARLRRQLVEAEDARRGR